MIYPYIQIDICFNDKIFVDAPFDKIPNITIPEQSQLVLALDPSSKQTGVALGDMKGNLYTFFDFKNKSCDLNEYKTYLNDYMMRLSDKYKIDYLVYEVPFKKSNDVAYDVLHNIEMTLRRYENVIKGLTRESMYPTLPGVWRKSFLADKRYTGRRRERELLKEAAREECSNRYPQYKDFFYATEYVPDCTDAIGIYHGFLHEYWYDRERQIRRVSKINSRYSRNHLYEKSIVNEPFESIIKIALNSANRDVSIFAYNKDFTTEENCEIVTSQTNNTCALIAFDELSKDLLKWESGFPQQIGCMYAVICRRKNKLR